MPAIDSLLRLVTQQGASALTLASGQVPRMTKAGASQPLSMPPVANALMDTLVGELLAPAQLEEAQRGPVVVDYGEFTATVKKHGDGWALSFARGIARPRPAAPAAPPPPVPPAPRPLPAFAPRAPADADPSPLDAWLGRVLADAASDLIISAGVGARLRLADGLVALSGAAPTSDQILALLAPALTEAHRAEIARHGSADLAWVWHGSDGERVRFRVNVFRQATGMTAVFRPVRRAPPTLAELRLPASLERLVAYPNGLVLVTGPSGSGKSTTLAALIEHVNSTSARHVLTIEDPIEYEYAPARALVHQRELGAHLDTFESGLRAALREAPDIILVGEMRDRATIAAAITAAETGHLVLSTLHAGGAAMAVERIIDVFPEHQQRQVRGQLAGTLRAVLTQHLLPTANGERVPAVELLLATPATASHIREGKTHQLASTIQTGRDEGMIPLDRSLADLVDARLVAADVAAAVTLDGGVQLRQLLRGRG
ncbi:MAG TPA: PilT/PilU family type 4a pilus ATPase [Haliangiales bacterium]|nr:PilT/PilU family type 4a pilus ATPase [Haliangiales bacterium]